MDNDEIDIDTVPDNGEYPVAEETMEDMLAEPPTQLESKIIDYRETLNNLGKPKTTIPYLTKYERARLIGVRAQQLNMGSPPLVAIGNLKKTDEIANKELLEKKIPLVIRRYLPDGTFEDWKIEELQLYNT